MDHRNFCPFPLSRFSLYATLILSDTKLNLLNWISRDGRRRDGPTDIRDVFEGLTVTKALLNNKIGYSTANTYFEIRSLILLSNLQNVLDQVKVLTVLTIV